MGLKETIKKDIDNLRADELVIIAEQIKHMKKTKIVHTKVLSVEEVRQLTSTSKTSWAEEVTKERQER